jgi:cytoskeletal protein CcmA (bactofilin family)
MWKKDPPEILDSPKDPVRQAPVQRRPLQRKSVDRLRERAVIGSAIIVNGELKGSQDLLVNGRIEGKVSLADHSLTVGRKGWVKADVYAKLISIEGEAEGTMEGEEKIVLRGTGNVRGNLVAPQVVLEEGCKFKGSIDMEDDSEDEEIVAANGTEDSPAPISLDTAAASPTIVPDTAVAPKAAASLPKA